MQQGIRRFTPDDEVVSDTCIEIHEPMPLPARSTLRVCLMLGETEGETSRMLRHSSLCHSSLNLPHGTWTLLVGSAEVSRDAGL